MKVDIRKEKIKMRRTLTNDEAGALSERICSRILAADEYKKADNILIYNAVNGEVNMSSLEKAAKPDGKILAYPLCLKDRKMEALVPEGEDAFVNGAFGIREPDPSRAKKIEPEQIDLVICPLTAFDEKCRRLGMGGGYYDRFLPKCVNAVIAAAAYEMQKVEEVPVEENDISVDIVFTESNVYTVK